MPFTSFHPVIAAWFQSHFNAPSEVQRLAWPAIQSGQSTLIAAPTGSGKTLAAFLAAINELLVQGLNGGLPDQTQVLYISPLKALSNDIHKNLEMPLDGIRFGLLEAGLPDVAIRAQTRTGDTSAAERRMMLKQPPHILVTTPESLYVLLTSDSGRELLKTVRSVIVDEIHALAGNKRGAHLSLSLARLVQLTATPPVRIGISATQKPITTIAHFLTGSATAPCTIVDTGHKRERDLQIEVTGSPLSAVMATEVWAEIYDRLAQFTEHHSTTLIFVNTRRLAERAAAALAERLGEDAVTAHHGSLAKEHRLAAEQRLKRGELKALVATASLELGIDIGDVDLVCQLGSPHGIGTFLQRVGRSGHRLSALPKGRLFPLSRDDLVECTALLAAIRRDELDRIVIPEQPLDVLAQQIVAEVACREWREDELFLTMTAAWPYRNLSRDAFTAVVQMLADGYSTRRGRRGAYLHRDVVNGLLRGRKNARLTALVNGGAIPDQFDYDVILQPEGLFVGTLNEDFAFESLPGDIFQLGNNSYRMLKIEQGRVFAEDAHGQPPNIPFWFGEAPGRSDELSLAVSDLRAVMDGKLEQGREAAMAYLLDDLRLPVAAAEQLFDYLAAAKAALTHLPTQQRIVFERFFDETGDMHFVVHSPYGSRINRAWGLALRKRFCRRFNFELQAAANEDSIVLSLGPTHSFPLSEPVGYLKAATVKAVLIQALLAAPMFPTRWRWVANTALAVPRNRAGKKVPAYFQRNDAEDLIAVIFPDQLACQENIAGDREIPDHPLVKQTLNDCLTELMDIGGLERLLDGIEQGQVEVLAKDLATPSPLAQEILNARPYAFLDDAPAEERRTLAVQQRRFLAPEEAADIGRLNPEAIAKVRQEAWPEVRDADELHDALAVLGFLTEYEGRDWTGYFAELGRTGRAMAVDVGEAGKLWVATERWPQFMPLVPGLSSDAEARHSGMDCRNPDHRDVSGVPAMPGSCLPWPLVPGQPSLCPTSRDDGDFHNVMDAGVAMREIVRSRLEGLGPVTAAQLAEPLALPVTAVDTALLALQQEGFVIQGRFTPDATQTEWCERGLLARIHRYTLKQLRSEIEPVSPQDFMRFLFHWHGLDEPAAGEMALQKCLLQLEGLSLPAASWENEVLPARLRPFLVSELDQLCLTGQWLWLRLKPPANSDRPKNPATKTTAISLIARSHTPHWRAYAPLPGTENLSGKAHKVYAALKQWGASFFADLLAETGLLKTELSEALAELAASGLVTSDNFHGLRTLITPAKSQQRRSQRYRGYDAYAQTGRWSLLRPMLPDGKDVYPHTEHIADILLKRYGVVFRKLLEQEDIVPTWRELLYVFRRKEARGELRGGRFVQGFAGEQYALPEAVDALRTIRKQDKTGRLITIAAVDPLNFTGIITPGQRQPAISGQSLLYRDGIPVAVATKGRVSFLVVTDEKEQWAFKEVLLRKGKIAR